jgi:hypothetical protein
MVLIEAHSYLLMRLNTYMPRVSVIFIPRMEAFSHDTAAFDLRFQVRAVVVSSRASILIGTRFLFAMKIVSSAWLLQVKRAQYHRPEAYFGTEPFTSWDAPLASHARGVVLRRFARGSFL